MSGDGLVFVFIFCSFAAFFVSIWCIDVSVSAMILSVQGGQELVMTNGFWTRTPAQTYHIGLWFAICSFSTVSSIAFWYWKGDHAKRE